MCLDLRPTGGARVIPLRDVACLFIFVFGSDGNQNSSCRIDKQLNNLCVLLDS